ncbi:MAG: Smr/MutS family protein [Salibacteraceae bacterium]
MNEKGEGVVIEITTRGQVMVEIDDFVFPYISDQLVRIPNDGESRDTSTVVSKANKSHPGFKAVRQKLNEPEFPEANPVQYSRRGRLNDKGVREVDLHIQNLTDSYRNLTNGEMLQIQLEHCRSAIESAIRQKEGKIIIIHGVGEGVLRTEVHQMLNDYLKIDYYDASFRRYGRGATEVVFL